MQPRRILIGRAKHPVVIVDGISGEVSAVRDIAAALAPFPRAAGNHYPGLRRVLGAGDAEAMAYIERTLEAAAPFIGGAFEVDRFDLIEASFSVITTPPEALAPPQRAPHFDSVDPNYVAVLHYLTPTAGTAFYRHRATGIEAVTSANRARFVEHARRESVHMRGYTAGSTTAFEQIATVEGTVDRLVIYPGRLLHSGIINTEQPLSSDPRRGRLTANLFVQLRP